MAYRATINGNVFFNTNSIDPSFGLLKATLKLKFGSAGLFSFTVAHNNKFYSEFHLISDYIDFYRDDELLFSGRVSSIEMNFDLTMNIEAEGLLSILNDTVFRPMTYEGTLYHLLDYIVANHNSQVENSKKINVGTITVADRTTNRLFENYISTLSCVNDIVDSYNCYPVIRKTNGALFLDLYQSITTQSTQSIDFGENELDVNQSSASKDYISVLIPLGAQIEDELTGERSRLTIESVNGGKDYIEVLSAPNKIVGTYIWDDITTASDLLNTGNTYLENQSVLRTTIKVTAVDLADVGYNIDHFKLGTIIEVTSRPHGLDGQTFECLEQTINPLNPEGNNLTLGGIVDGFTIRAQKEAKLNTKIVEKIEASYTTNKRLNDIKTTLEQDIQENYTLIEQNSEQIRLLASEVVSVSKIFYEIPTPPYKKGDLWYRGADEDDNTSAIPGLAVPGMSTPGTGGDLFVATHDRDESDSFNASDWSPVYKGQLNYINKRVSRAEVSINGAKADINLQASQIESLTGRMSSAEIDIDGANAQIALKVNSSDYNGASIVAKINSAGSSVSIDADKINLNGAVTANNYFKINTDGSMETIAGKIGGFEIDATSFHTTGRTLSDNQQGSIGLTSSVNGFTRNLRHFDINQLNPVYVDEPNLMLAIASTFAVDFAGNVHAGSINASGGMWCNSGYIRNGGLGHPLRGQWTFDDWGKFTITDPSDSSAKSVFQNGGLTFQKDYVSHESGGDVTKTRKLSLSPQSISGSSDDSSCTFNRYGVRESVTFTGNRITMYAATGVINCTTCNQSSDIKLKNNIKKLDLSESSNFIYELIPYSFNFKHDPTKTRHGFLADQISSINKRKWDLVSEQVFDNDSFKTVAYMDIIADLVATVQSHNQRLIALEEKEVDL